MDNFIIEPLSMPKPQLSKLPKAILTVQMSLTEDCKKELQWWVDNVVSSDNVITPGQPSNTLTTDASQNGWGGGRFTMTQALEGFGPTRKNFIT